MNKKIISVLLIVLITVSLTACGGNNSSSDNSKETIDAAQPDKQSSSQTEKCKYDPDDVKDMITDFGRDHGLRVENILCYKSDRYFKIDITRISSEYDLQRQYEDAISDIIATGNKLKASKMFFNVETVLTDDNGYFIIYITYDYEYDLNSHG